MRSGLDSSCAVPNSSRRMDWRLKEQRVSLYCASEARYPRGKGEVCKTFTRGFDSHPRLHLLSNKIDSSIDTTHILYLKERGVPQCRDCAPPKTCWRRSSPLVWKSSRSA